MPSAEVRAAVDADIDTPREIGRLGARGPRARAGQTSRIAHLAD
jgi:hypothetical protein